MNTWDVIVVGGGPAGSSAAKVVAEAAYSVLVLDKKKVIGEPNHCGEGISISDRAAKAGEVITEALKKDDSYLLSDYPRRVKLYPCRDRVHLMIPQAFFRSDNRIINTIGKIMDGKEYTEIPVIRFLRYFLRHPTPRILWGIAVGFAVQRFYHKSEPFAW
ncbi:FAD-dependent oxidoreductase [candidate division WOR-3 bacterium]|nr:FAD-dependent oxidoreductase [candidate division WOR-3 bacterium]MCK4333773.1 FAD-dependent oxidoreductase [candidate division WOR-3 bacterium]